LQILRFRLKDEWMTHMPRFRFAHCLPSYWLAVGAGLAMCLVLLVATEIWAQNVPGQQHAPGSLSPGPHITDSMDDTPSPQSIEEEKALRALNVARQKSLVADTDRLVRLVNELNAEIARTNPDSLTAAQLRKVAEIEKLAHNVKDKMSTSLRGLPAFPQLNFPQR
jgi:hypothetical protein